MEQLEQVILACGPDLGVATASLLAKCTTLRGHAREDAHAGAGAAGRGNGRQRRNSVFRRMSAVMSKPYMLDPGSHMWASITSALSVGKNTGRMARRYSNLSSDHVAQLLKRTSTKMSFWRRTDSELSDRLGSGRRASNEASPDSASVASNLGLQLSTVSAPGVAERVDSQMDPSLLGITPSEGNGGRRARTRTQWDPALLGITASPVQMNLHAESEPGSEVPKPTGDALHAVFAAVTEQVHADGVLRDLALEDSLLKALNSEAAHTTRYAGCWERGVLLQDLWSRCSVQQDLLAVIGLSARLQGLTQPVAAVYADYWHPALSSRVLEALVRLQAHARMTICRREYTRVRAAVQVIQARWRAKATKGGGKPL